MYDRFMIPSVFACVAAAMLAVLGSSPALAGPGDGYEELRTCQNREYIRSVASHESKQNSDAAEVKQRYTNVPAANVVYSVSMERLIVLEMENIEQSLKTIAEKYAELQEVTGRRPSPYTMVLEKFPGVWRDGQFVRAEKAMHLHFDEAGQVTCVVLEAMNVPVNLPAHWTRKYIRLYLPHVRILEMETFRKNYRLYNTLNEASIAHRLDGLRVMNEHVRTVVYRMDMEIASFYDRRENRAGWQTDI